MMPPRWLGSASWLQARPLSSVRLEYWLGDDSACVMRAEVPMNVAENVSKRQSTHVLSNPPANWVLYLRS